MAPRSVLRILLLAVALLFPLVGPVAGGEPIPAAEPSADRSGHHTPAPAAGPIEIRQDALDEEERLPPERILPASRVLAQNRALFGAQPIDFCRRMAREERLACLPEVEAISDAKIAGPVELIEVSNLRDGGKEWPNAGRVSDFRRLRFRVPLAKGSHRTRHEANIVEFRSGEGDDGELCTFPLEPWTWSEMERPERFRQASIGECGGRKQTVTEYLLEQAPNAAPEVLRFLSEPEARAWQSRDPERIKWESSYTAGHPYAKFFLLDSDRWWRGGTKTRRDGYGWAVRIPELPLQKIRAWEARGDLFLDIFEDGAQIELTNVTRAGLLELLGEDPEVLIDVSEAGDIEPRFQPLPAPAR